MNCQKDYILKDAEYEKRKFVLVEDNGNTPKGTVFINNDPAATNIYFSETKSKSGHGWFVEESALDKKYQEIK